MIGATRKNPSEDLPWIGNICLNHGKRVMSVLLYHDPGKMYVHTSYRMYVCVVPSCWDSFSRCIIIVCTSRVLEWGNGRCKIRYIQPTLLIIVAASNRQPTSTLHRSGIIACFESFLCFDGQNGKRRILVFVPLEARTHIFIFLYYLTLPASHEDNFMVCGGTRTCVSLVVS